MDQEIELKFIVRHDGVETLRQHLNTFCAEHIPPAQLLNIYYETADSWLRRHDMGLRIRGHNGQYEMTMKIAGRVVGGLHQRPEYNIPLEKPELALEKLPAEVWPDGALPAGLSAQVNPLFSTDFHREKWLVRQGESRIEIALDLGDVKAGAQHEPLCELELELLSGRVDDVLSLSARLLDLGVLRQGSLSKAARGYHLAQGNVARQVKPTRLSGDDNAALDAALAHWQYHEELWLRGNAAAKAQVLQAVQAIQAIAARRDAQAGGRFAQVLHQLTAADDAAVAYHPQVAQAKLQLTTWLVSGH